MGFAFDWAINSPLQSTLSNGLARGINGELGFLRRA
jgi:hypothetical protein